MYIVANHYTSDKGVQSTMAEKFFDTIDEALDDYAQRRGRERDIIIAKVLPVKVVLCDENDYGTTEHDLAD